MHVSACWKAQESEITISWVYGNHTQIWGRSPIIGIHIDRRFSCWPAILYSHLLSVHRSYHITQCTLVVYHAIVNGSVFPKMSCSKNAVVKLTMKIIACDVMHSQLLPYYIRKTVLYTEDELFVKHISYLTSTPTQQPRSFSRPSRPPKWMNHI